MKLLLLSCPTGEGHNSARRALAEELKRQGVEYVLADPVGFQSKRARELVAAAYNGLIRRAPTVFGMVYRAGAVYESTGLRSPVYYANAHYASTLHDYLQAERFDGVLSTHLFGLEAVTAIRRRTGAHIPSFGVLTDYTCIPQRHPVRPHRRERDPGFPPIPRPGRAGSGADDARFAA